MYIPCRPRLLLRHRNRQPCCPKAISGRSPVNPLSSFFPRVSSLFSSSSPPPTLSNSSIFTLYPFTFLLPSHNVRRSSFFQPLPEAGFLRLGQPGACPVLRQLFCAYRFTEKSYPRRAIFTQREFANISFKIGLQGRRPRCFRWHWPTPLSALEAQPPCFRALPL